MLPRISQAIVITALLYLIVGMSDPNAVSGSSNTTIEPSLAQQDSSPKQLAEVINFQSFK